MMSMSVLLCTPRKPPCLSFSSIDSMQSTKLMISFPVFGFSM